MFTGSSVFVYKMGNSVYLALLEFWEDQLRKKIKISGSIYVEV